MTQSKFDNFYSFSFTDLFAI